MGLLMRVREGAVRPVAALVGALTHDQLRAFAVGRCAGLGPEASDRVAWQADASFGVRRCWGRRAPIHEAADHGDPYNSSGGYSGIDPAHPGAAGARWVWVSCSGTCAAVVSRRGRGPSWQIYLWRVDDRHPANTDYAASARALGVALTEGTLSAEAQLCLLDEGVMP